MATKKRAKKPAKAKKRAKVAEARRSRSGSVSRERASRVGSRAVAGRGSNPRRAPKKSGKGSKKTAQRAREKKRAKRPTVASGRAKSKPLRKSNAKPKQSKKETRRPKPKPRKTQAKPRKAPKAKKPAKRKAAKKTAKKPAKRKKRGQAVKTVSRIRRTREQVIATSRERLQVEAMQFYRELSQRGERGGGIRRVRERQTTRFRHVGRQGLEVTIKIARLLDDASIEDIMYEVDQAIETLFEFHSHMYASILCYQTAVHGTSPNAQVFQDPKTNLAMYGGWTGVRQGDAHGVRVRIERKLQKIIDADPQAATVVHTIVVRGIEPGDQADVDDED